MSYKLRAGAGPSYTDIYYTCTNVIFLCSVPQEHALYALKYKSYAKSLFYFFYSNLIAPQNLTSSRQFCLLYKLQCIQADHAYSDSAYGATLRHSQLGGYSPGLEYIIVWYIRIHLFGTSITTLVCSNRLNDLAMWAQYRPCHVKVAWGSFT